MMMMITSLREDPKRSHNDDDDDDDDNQCEGRPQEEPAQNFGPTNSLIGSRHPVRAIFKSFSNFQQQNWDSYST